ncbi:hypothetical protein WDU94_006478 [Cyamophila willieti]
MSHDETKHVECQSSSNVAQERDQHFVSHVGQLDEVFTYEEAQENVRTARKVPDDYRDGAKYEGKRDDDDGTADKEKKENPAGSASQIVSNVTDQIRFTSTEELHEKIPIYSEHILDIWRSNNKRQAAQERSSCQKSGLAQPLQSSSNQKFGLEPLGLGEGSAFSDESEPNSLSSSCDNENISTDGSENIQNDEEIATVQTVNNPTRYKTAAENQNITLVHTKQYVNEFKVSNVEPNEQRTDKSTDTNSQRDQNLQNQRESRLKSKYVTNDDTSSSEKWKNSQASSHENFKNLQERDEEHLQVPDNSESNTSNAAEDNNDGINFSEDARVGQSNDEQTNVSIDEDGYDITPEELLESLQLSQSSEGVHESHGEQSDCLFHLTNDGTQGFQNIRLRVMLPALNKGKT